jgi:choline dehydrogenase
MHDHRSTAYDYVIVGAGSAGCVLAARLTEDPGTRVLLLEAGPPDTAKQIQVPAALVTLVKGPYDWDYATVPQKHAASRTVSWPRGHTLGGSSAINGMIYVRGNPVDYDTWRDRYGCAGWGYADLLPYFRRAEDQQRGVSEFHGTGGPLRVEDLRFRHPLPRAWVASALRYGLAANDDFNAVEQDGVGFYQVTQRRGRRWSTADGYLRPAMQRDNLTVETDALVTKVLVEGGRAVGVQYAHHGSRRLARAGGDVILSGGTINTPQLLMLSGIGPADHLRAHDIDVVVDVPGVGAGLQDHPTCTAIWNTPRTRNIWEDMNRVNMLRWQVTRRGPMVSIGAEAGGFVRTRSDLPAPDLQFHVISAPFVDQGLVPPDRRAVSVVVTALDVHSRGHIRLRSGDPRDKPAIDPAYLADEADVDTLVAGIRQARNIAAHEPLARQTDGELAPGPHHATDDQVREWIRHDVVTLYHPTSTCAMGAARSAVCDLELRVRGIDGLRVVDASVMPAIPRGNTNAPTIAIAERAADLIRGATPLALATKVI